VKDIEGIYLLLGTNLGNRKENLEKAFQSIAQQIGPAEAVSSLYETEAWGETEQPVFLNQVIKVNTNLSPEELLHHIHTIEQKMGRLRHQKWAERIIDIDILYYHDRIIHTPNLKIPHPGIPHRRFTLVPLCEIAAEAVHPELHKTQQELLNECADPLKVWRWEETNAKS
jgi:2-amino-4-hydroxy-6-hydroxymethyldihydropteridine diphosphokinase